jgi:hypothetical protein
MLTVNVFRAETKLPIYKAVYITRYLRYYTKRPSIVRYRAG